MSNPALDGRFEAMAAVTLGKLNGGITATSYPSI
jgi:hypothetical protein